MVPEIYHQVKVEYDRVEVEQDARHLYFMHSHTHSTHALIVNRWIFAYVYAFGLSCCETRGETRTFLWRPMTNNSHLPSSL